MSRITKWCDRTFYPAFADRWDEIMLRERILSVMSSRCQALDLGAGRGHNEILNFRGRCAHVAGADPDRAVLTNSFLDEARVQEPPEYRIPYDDARFDLVFSNSVIEHITNEGLFFREIARVLKPGGTFVAKTPNRLHYVSLMASLTPHWFHDFYNRVRGRDGKDTFPTTYACNTQRRLLHTMAASGLRVDRIELVEGRPEYLRVSLPTYMCGLIYERLVNATRWLEPFRCVIFVQAQKPH